MENRKSKILIIDDEEPIRKFLKIHLVKEGYEVTQSAGGKTVFEDIKEADFDIVVSDIKMPDVGGIKILEYIKKNYDGIPVIMLTGFVDVSVAMDVMHKGAFDYIAKPVKKDTILPVVRKALGHRKLHLENQRLAKENKSYQASLEQNIMELHNATELKDKFISIVSHDLRSPIGGIAGWLELILDSSTQIDKDEMFTFAQKAKRTTDGLLHMIDQLLTIASIQRGNIKLEVHPLNIKSVADKYINYLAFQYENKNIAVHNQIPEDVIIYADETLIGEVILNLVSNSVKFCDSGDSVTLFAPDGRTDTIAVKDSGKGVDKSIVDDIFKHDVKTSTKGTGGEKGSGLGLPLCLDIVEAHGGFLTVESNDGEGSIFFIEIPRETARDKFLGK